MADVRLWPPDDADTTFIEYNPERFEQVVANATAIRDEVIRNGIALTPEDIPFEACGCYFCGSETLTFPCVSDKTTAEVAPGGRSTATDDASAAATPSSGDHDRGPQAPSVIPPATGETQVVRSNTQHVPRGLREHGIWTG